MTDLPREGRRARQTRETRRRIRDAALELFTAQGYTTTTVQQIADRADVAWQTVYSVFGTKAALLSEIFDMTVAGDDEPAPMAERPFVDAIAAAPDARTKARVFAAHLRETAVRSAAVQAVIESAAAADPDIARLWDKLMAQLTHGMSLAAADFRRQGVLRADLTVEQAADRLWWYAGPWAYRGLVLTKGWTPEQYEQWLYESLYHEVLNPVSD